MSDDLNTPAVEDTNAATNTQPAVDTPATTPVDNPPTTPATPAATDPVSAGIIAKFDNKVDVAEVNFHFKKVTDAAGNESKRPTVTLKLPVPSVEGLVQIITDGGKGLELLLEAAKEVIIKQTREIVNVTETIDQESLPLDQLSWEAIANLPQAERRGGGIPKETWEEFGKDYIAVMPAVTGKKLESVTLAAKVFLLKFSNVKTDKKALALLKAQLALYATNSPNVEEYIECVQFLDKKADTLLAADSSNLLDAL